DEPLNPISLALGAEGTFVARTIDSDRRHLTAVLSEAARHRGTSFVEIYQNCPIFNDGAFDAVKDVDTRDEAIIGLEQGKPIRFGNGDRLGLLRNRGTGSLEIVEVDESNIGEVLIHDANADDPTTAFALSRLTDSGVVRRAPIGIFRQVERPTYDDLSREQLRLAGNAPSLQKLIDGPDAWEVS
ncbi:MAG TPA: 2-oxoacid:ferredoxin oxidoreductase subunit beta, partial [Aeromicrobium sp.]|nr:2-oxoacid:ferredoxin oxidoreductase subunit beta [Aeromicrobium sp.]